MGGCVDEKTERLQLTRSGTDPWGRTGGRGGRPSTE